MQHLRLKILFLVLLCPALSFGQSDSLASKNIRVLPIEGEVSIGLMGAADCNPKEILAIGVYANIELRYNFDGKPYDAGIQLGKIVGTNFIDDGNNGSDAYQIVLVGNKNYRQGKDFNPYLGVGIGLKIYENNETIGDCRDCIKVDHANTYTAFLVGRAGLEIFKTLRLALSGNLSPKGINQIQLSLGLTFGGYKRKK